MWANTHKMIVSFSFWDEMMKNMIINDKNLSEQIITCLFTQSNEGSHDCEQYPKRLLFLMKAWIMFIVWHVVSMPAFLWLWANPHQAWDVFMSLLRILELKTYCSSSTCMLRALSRLSAYKELPHEDSKWSICPSIDKKITPRNIQFNTWNWWWRTILKKSFFMKNFFFVSLWVNFILLLAAYADIWSSWDGISAEYWLVVMRYLSSAYLNKNK